jgi:hypothetical protein
MKKRSTGLNSILKSDSPNQSRMGLTEDDLFSSINFFNKRVDDSHNENSSPAINSLYQNRQMIGVENKNFFDYLNFNYDKEKLLINTKEITKYENKRFDSMKKISSRIKVAQTIVSPSDLDKFYNDSIEVALRTVLPKITETKGATHIPADFGPFHGGGETWKAVTSGYENDNFKKISSRSFKKIAFVDDLIAQIGIVDIQRQAGNLSSNLDVSPDVRSDLRSYYNNNNAKFMQQYAALSPSQQEIINKQLGLKGPDQWPRPKPTAPLARGQSPTSAQAPLASAPAKAPTPSVSGAAPAAPVQAIPGKPITGTQLRLPFGEPPTVAPPAAPSAAPSAPTGAPSPRFFQPEARWTSPPPSAPLAPSPGTAMAPYEKQLPAVRPKSRGTRGPKKPPPSRLSKFLPKSRGGRVAAGILAALVADEVLNQSAAVSYGRDLAGIFEKEFRKMLDIFITKNNAGQTFGSWVYSEMSKGSTPQDATNEWFDELSSRGVPEVFSGSVNNMFAEKLRIWGKGLWNLVSFGSGSELLTELNAEALSYANEAVGLMRSYVLGKVSTSAFVSTVAPLSQVSGVPTTVGNTMRGTPAGTSSIPADPAWIPFDSALRTNGAAMVGSVSKIHDLWNQKYQLLQMMGYRYDHKFSSYKQWYKDQAFAPGSGGVPDQEAALNKIT